MATSSSQPLSQLVKIGSGAKNPLNLAKVNFNQECGQAGESRFRPLSPQLEALRLLASWTNRGGSVALAGIFGSGKTTLLHFLGRALTLPYPSEDFSAHMASLGQAAAAREFSKLRKSGRRWLIVTPVLTEFRKFEEAMRLALSTALNEVGYRAFLGNNLPLLDTYREALEGLKEESLCQGIVILLDDIDQLMRDAGSATPSMEAQDLRFFTEALRRDPRGMTLIVTRNGDDNSLPPQDEERLCDAFSEYIALDPLGRPGEWEELMATTLISHNTDEAWQELCAHPDFESLGKEVEERGLYSSHDSAWIKRYILQGAYPLHPAVVFSLPRLAIQLASRERTVFNFFSDLAPGGLSYFVRNFTVAQASGRLNYYTLDSLFAYFERSFSQDGEHTKLLRALNNGVLVAGDIPQARRILRIILLIQLLGDARLKSTARNILWAMHLGERESKVAANSLTLLRMKQVLNYNAESDEYLLPIEPRRATLDEVLPRLRNRYRSQLNIGAIVSRHLPFKRVEAKVFNRTYKADRYAQVEVYPASKLLCAEHFVEGMRERFARLRPYRGDIALVLAVPESKEEFAILETSLTQGAFDDAHLLVALPQGVAILSDLALEVRALERLSASCYPFVDPLSEERRQIAQRLQEAKERLRESLRAILDLHNWRLYYQGQSYSGLDQKGLERLIDEQITYLVGKSPRLEEAQLCHCQETHRDNRDRYALLNNILQGQSDFLVAPPHTRWVEVGRAALVATDILLEKKARGGWSRFQVNHEDPETEVGLAYNWICKELIGQRGERTQTSAEHLVRTLAYAPYGFTPALIEILLALACWQLRGLLTLSSGYGEPVEIRAQAIRDLVTNPQGWEFTFEDCTEVQARFLEGLLDFCCAELTIESIWKVTCDALAGYYEALPELAKVAGASGSEKIERLRQALEVISQERPADPRLFLAVELPALCGYGTKFRWEEYSDDLLEQVEEGLRQLEMIPGQVAHKLGNDLGELFTLEGAGEDLSWSVKAERWYQAQDFKGLEERWFSELEGLRSVFGCVNSNRALSLLLEALHYPQLDEWHEDWSAEILERFKALRSDVAWQKYRPTLSDPAPEAWAYAQFRPLLLQAQLSDLEPFLCGELEWASWPEMTRRHLEPVSASPDPGDDPTWHFKGSTSAQVEEILEALKLRRAKNPTPIPQELDWVPEEFDLGLNLDDLLVAQPAPKGPKGPSRRQQKREEAERAKRLEQEAQAQAPEEAPKEERLAPEAASQFLSDQQLLPPRPALAVTPEIAAVTERPEVLERERVLVGPAATWSQAAKSEEPASSAAPPASSTQDLGELALKREFGLDDSALEWF